MFTGSGGVRAQETYFNEFSLSFALQFLVIMKMILKAWLLLTDFVFEWTGVLGAWHLLVMALSGCRCLILKLLMSQENA